MNSDFIDEDKKEEWIEKLLEDHTLVHQAEKEGILEYFEPWDWIELIIKHPIIGGFCKSWENFSANDWAILLSEMPFFFEKCNIWDEFEVQDWVMLLSSRGNMRVHCHKWSEFTAEDWVYLLSEQPSLARYCDKWEDFTLEDWEILSPELYEYCPEEILKQLQPPKEKRTLKLQGIILRPTFELTQMLYPELSEIAILHKQGFLAEHFLFPDKFNIPYGLEKHIFCFQKEEM